MHTHNDLRTLYQDLVSKRFYHQSLTHEYLGNIIHIQTTALTKHDIILILLDLQRPISKCAQRYERLERNCMTNVFQEDKNNICYSSL